MDLPDEAYSKFLLIVGNLLYTCLVFLESPLPLKIPILVLASPLPLMLVLATLVAALSFFRMVYAIRKGCNCSWGWDGLEFDYSGFHTKYFAFDIHAINSCPYHKEKHETAIVKSYLLKNKRSIEELLTHKNPNVRSIAKKLRNV